MLKSTLKLTLLVCLFSSIAFADGDMTGGGFADDGDMTGGGKNQSTNGGTLTNAEQTQDNSILIFVREYLYSIFG